MIRTSITLDEETSRKLEAMTTADHRNTSGQIRFLVANEWERRHGNEPVILDAPAQHTQPQHP